MRQLPAKSAFLHAAEGDAWVGGAIAVDEYTTGFKLAGQLLGKLDIACVDGGVESELTVIGQRQCVCGIARGNDRGDRANRFLPAGGHLVGDTTQAGGLRELAGASNPL